MERMILVNELDQETGYGEKLAVHQEGLLHRAFSVFLWREDRLLLQKRALVKYHSGGLWANTCCSHPRPGEEIIPAARRRLQEECGIVSPPLYEAFSFIYRAELAGGLWEHEFDHVLLGHYPKGSFSPDPGEIAELRWWSLEELDRALARQEEIFAPWFKLCAPRVISLLQQHNSDIIL